MDNEITSAALPELAWTVNESQYEINRTHEKSIILAVTAGEALNEAKALVEHGQWNKWLKANCDVSPRMARNYMSLARDMPRLSVAKRKRVADLSLREAVKELANERQENCTSKLSMKG